MSKLARYDQSSLFSSILSLTVSYQQHLLTYLLTYFFVSVVF